MAVTLGFIFLFGYHEGTREWAIQHMEMFWVAFALMFITIITLSCCEGVRRTSPHNFIALSLFTLAESYLVAMSTMRFSRDDVNVIPIYICVSTNQAVNLIDLKNETMKSIADGLSKRL